MYLYFSCFSPLQIQTTIRSSYTTSNMVGRKKSKSKKVSIYFFIGPLPPSHDQSHAQETSKTYKDKLLHTHQMHPQTQQQLPLTQSASSELPYSPFSSYLTTLQVDNKGPRSSVSLILCSQSWNQCLLRPTSLLNSSEHTSSKYQYHSHLPP